MKKLLLKLGEWFDLRDAFTFGGLACAFYGMHQVSPPAAWLVLGAACFWIGGHR